MFVEGGKTITKPDVFSLESLIAWLEKMPADEKYNWDDGEKCLLGRWLRTIDPAAKCNFGELTGYNYYCYIVNGATVDLSKFAHIARDNDDWDTFGNALSRARALASRA